MKELTELRALVESWQSLAQRGRDAAELIELGDESMAADLNAEVEVIQHELDRREFDLMLSGPHDHGNALIALHAGAGGVDAADWTAMLLRMYLRWAEDHGYKADIVDQMEGDEAGIKNVTVTITGLNAYGYLRSERGVHRLVRLSPFDSAHRRHTSFSLVEVWPELGEGEEIEIKPQDIKIDTYKSAGAGGQNVQKNETAIRITHLPTGIVVTCQNERSQTQNRETALKILRAKLYELEEEKRHKELVQSQGRARQGRVGQPDPIVCAASLSTGQRPSHRIRKRQHAGGARRPARRLHGSVSALSHGRVTDLYAICNLTLLVSLESDNSGSYSRRARRPIFHLLS